MMFGLTKREQRWAAEQKAAETIVPLLTAAIEARTAMDTNDRIAALERDLTQAVQMYTDAAGERDKALADLAAAQAERDALRKRANALLHQIDIGDYVDSEGHALKNNIAVLTLMKALTNV